MAQSDVKSTQGMAILTFGAFGPVLPCITVVVLVLIWCFAFLLFSTDGIEMGICFSLQVCRAFWLAVTSRSIPQAGSSQPIELWVVPTHRTPGRPNPSNSGSSQPVDGRIGRRWADHCQTLWTSKHCDNSHLDIDCWLLYQYYGCATVDSTTPYTTAHADWVKLAEYYWDRIVDWQLWLYVIGVNLHVQFWTSVEASFPTELADCHSLPLHRRLLLITRSDSAHCNSIWNRYALAQNDMRNIVQRAHFGLIVSSRRSLSSFMQLVLLDDSQFYLAYTIEYYFPRRITRVRTLGKFWWEVWRQWMEGKRFGDCRNSGADELIAFHMNIGKQFFMIASSVNFSPFHFA